jgi:DUF1680 family protein
MTTPAGRVAAVSGHELTGSSHGAAMSPVAPTNSPYRGLGLDEVAITGGFWADRQRINASRTLRHIEHWQEREGWIGNFDRVVAGEQRTRRGREFSDSEVYKLLEAMAWELGRQPDPDLEARFNAIVARVAAAQDRDGYISTKFGHDGQPERYSDLEWGHELYCQGHLIQAAVARARTGHVDDKLVDIARRSADHICETFGPTGRQSICGHAEIEVALAELSRVTGEGQYLRQAEMFIERHGNHTLDDIELGRAYYQDDVKVRNARVFRGHAVRANYLAAGAVDVAVESNDHELLDAVTRQWRTTQAKRTYITGGQGSRHVDEGFGEDFYLPPDRAYSETCAAVASNMVSWRLLLTSGAAEFGDAIERTLYNVIATSPDRNGTAFYYANTLHQRVPGDIPAPGEVSKRAQSSLRAPWFEVSCCPPNVARTLASLGAYLATVTPTELQLHQYAPATINTRLGTQPLSLDVETNYPDSGRILIKVIDAPAERWQLTLRVPGWASDGASITGTGITTRQVDPGMVTVDGPPAGGEVVLDLAVHPRFMHADPRIDAVRGTVAVQRGPEVWCLESIDMPLDEHGVDVSRVHVDTDVPPRFENDRVVVHARVATPQRDQSWPFGSTSVAKETWSANVDVPLVRYHDWARREPSTMRVWIPTA